MHNTGWVTRRAYDSQNTCATYSQTVFSVEDENRGKPHKFMWKLKLAVKTTEEEKTGGRES